MGRTESASSPSRNAHKARELERLLPGWTIEPLDADEWPPETGETYYENALAKARFGRDAGDRERWAIGEDSGIEVAALDGRPASTRRGTRPEGAPAIAKLLGELDGARDRRARYVSELVALAPDGREVRGSGILEGRIADAASGVEGFGYDPVFVPDGEETHRRGARRRVEGRALAPRPRGARATRGRRAPRGRVTRAARRSTS